MADETHIVSDHLATILSDEAQFALDDYFPVTEGMEHGSWPPVMNDVSKADKRCARVQQSGPPSLSTSSL